MLKFASQLTESGEALVGWWGQSNAEPHGARDSEGFQAGAALHLAGGIVRNLGTDLTITDITGSLVQCGNTFDSLYWTAQLGKTVRLSWTVYGTAGQTARPGIGVVTGVATNSLTVDWSTAVANMPTTTAVTFTIGAPGLVNITGHEYQRYDRIQFADSAAGVLPNELAFGTTYYVSEIVGVNQIKIAATFDHVTAATHLDFTGSSSGTMLAVPLIGGSMWFEDGRGVAYSHIRMLTEWLPENTGDYPTTAVDVPNASFPSSISLWEDVGLFLPFCFNEGIDGFGTSNSGGTVTYGSNTMADSSKAHLVNVFVGARCQVGAQIMTVASNTATTMTFTESWATTPSAGDEYELSLPHFRDNVNSWTHGEGFRRPSNFTSPIIQGGTGQVYNRARSRMTPSYVLVTGTEENRTQNHKFGAVLPTMWQIAMHIGRRVNVVPCTAGSASLARGGGNLYFEMGPPEIGWASRSVLRDFVVGDDTGLAYRYEKMWTTVAPAALIAEGNAKTGKCIGIVGFQGETESLDINTTVADNYGSLLSGFINWHRRMVHYGGMSAYDDPAHIPVVHAKVGPDWSGTTALAGATAGNGDTVNDAIEQWALKTRASATFTPSTAQTAGHYTGLGEAFNGITAGDELATLIDIAVGQSIDPAAVEICNLALAHIGEEGNIDSLDTSVDQSTEAAVCSRFYETARNAVLEKHSWGFSTRHATLTEVTKDTNRTEWDYAYVLPDDCASVISVIPQGGFNDYTMPYAPSPDYQVPAGNLTGAQSPVRFAVERDHENCLVLYTDLENARIRYNVRINSSIDVPHLFKLALSWYLASLIAGPIIKGDGALAATKRAMGMFQMVMGEAVTNDGHQHDARPQHNVDWISGR